MLLPLAVAIAGFFGYRSYKRTGRVPFLGGPRNLPPAPTPPPAGFAAQGEFAPADHAEPLPVAPIGRVVPQQAPIAQRVAGMAASAFNFQPIPKKST